jgi:hypothetical protein
MLKQLLARQAELNSQLDMEKGDLTGRGFCARSWHDLDMGKGVPVATGQLGKMADGICELCDSVKMPILRILRRNQER